MDFGKILTKEKLKTEYWDNRKSMNKIGLEVGCHGVTVLAWMKKYNIPRRIISGSLKGEKHWNWGNRRNLNKDELIDLYWNKQKSSREIAPLLEVTQDCVLEYMNRYNIPRRTRSEAIKLHPPKTAFLKGFTPWNKDKKFLGGEKYGNWKGGITPLNKNIRNSFKYRQWRSDVFTRDDFTCQECGRRECFINAHHILSVSDIVELNDIRTMEQAIKCEELWNINNGLTLCEDCHNLTKGRPIHGLQFYEKPRS